MYLTDEEIEAAIRLMPIGVEFCLEDIEEMYSQKEKCNMT